MLWKMVFSTQKSSRPRRTRSDFADFPNRQNRSGSALAGLKTRRVFNLPPGTMKMRKVFGFFALSRAFLTAWGAHTPAGC